MKFLNDIHQFFSGFAIDYKKNLKDTRKDAQAKLADLQQLLNKSRITKEIG